MVNTGKNTVIDIAVTTTTTSTITVAVVAAHPLEGLPAKRVPVIGRVDIIRADGHRRIAKESRRAVEAASALPLLPRNARINGMGEVDMDGIADQAPAVTRPIP